ncbi:MAG: FkbM family methyltransferase [Burkholderiaceae bacterium]
MKIVISRLFKFLSHGGLRGHFSQYGEDVFLHKFFRGKRNGYYIDIGAHHPFELSNTAHLWLSGWNGINVDASAATIASFDKVRKADLNIHAAVVSSATSEKLSQIEFYSNEDIDNIATCDPELAKERGYKRSIKVPCRSLKSLVQEGSLRSSGQFDYLNIDIEGLDESVLEDINTWAMKPKVLMVEIYAQTIRDMLNNNTVINLEKNDYKFIERTGHTAIFILDDLKLR